MKSKVITVWDDRYCVKAAPLTSTTKQIDVVRRVESEGLIDLWVGAKFDEEAAWSDIARTHDPVYVSAVRTGKPRELATSQGFRWSQEFADSLPLIWDGHLAACRFARELKTLVLHPVSGAHHAGYRSGSGFCTFNYLVGAARDLLESGMDRVGIIDLDAHQGNGTQELLRSGISVFDISGSSWGCTPDKNVLYLTAKNAQWYFRHLRLLTAWLDVAKPQFVQYQAGMDVFEHDPVGGINGMTQKRLQLRDAFVIREIMKRKIPCVVNLAGGYLEGETIRMHVQTIRTMYAALNCKGA